MSGPPKALSNWVTETSSPPISVQMSMGQFNNDKNNLDPTVPYNVFWQWWVFKIDWGTAWEWDPSMTIPRNPPAFQRKLARGPPLPCPQLMELALGYWLHTAILFAGQCPWSVWPVGSADQEWQWLMDLFWFFPRQFGCKIDKRQHKWISFLWLL